MQLIGNNYLFLLSLFLFSLSFSLATSSTTNDHFKENLQVEVLPDGKIISRFSFDIEWKINTQDNYSCILNTKKHFLFCIYHNYFRSKVYYYFIIICIENLFQLFHYHSIIIFIILLKILLL